MSDEYVIEVFGADGMLARKFPGYQPREGQIEMALAVNEAMDNGTSLLVEAPTGTGKSLAYGVPASKFGSLKQTTVIVTANIALQEQLIRKDLPLISEIVHWKFEFAIAKGINNYVCLDVYEQNVNDSLMKEFDGTRVESEQWKTIMAWADKTLTGDLSELEIEPSPKLRSRFTTTSDECLGRKCSHYDNCHVMRQRLALRRANVIVTNYSMFFIDLNIRNSGGDGILPQYTHVVFDEGHKMAELARDFMGFSVSQFGVARAIKLLDHEQSEKSRKGRLPVINSQLKASATKACDELFSELSLHAESADYNTRFRREWTGSLQRKAYDLDHLLQKASKVYVEATANESLTEERSLELTNFASLCAQYGDNIRRVADMSSDEGWVFYLDEMKSGSVAIKGTPIDVSKFLRERVFENSEIKSTVVTSATMATTVGDFDYLSEQIGSDDAELLTVESPFDVATNMLVVVPPMPEPSDRKFSSAVAKRVMEIVEESKGRALCLFTSHRSMKEVYDIVSRDFPYTLYKQGDAPRVQLIERFRSEVSSVLFGTESFWAGVDVPGESLSVVVIDKLPFPNIGDPVQDALKEELGRQYFTKCSVPAAVLAFRQGVGRLLRTVNDRGVVVILDCRVVEKPYGKSFIRSFPSGTRVSRDVGEIGYFLKGE